MARIRRSWFLASTLVALVLSTSCSKADESAPKADLVVVRPSADEALISHSFLRVTEARSGLLDDLFVDRRLELAVDELENYYLGVGPRVIVVDRGAAKPFMRAIELPTSLRLLGIRNAELILLGEDPSRCDDVIETGRLYREPEACASVFAIPTDGAGKLRVVAAFDNAIEPMLVGEHVVAFADDHTLMHVALTGGEVRRTGFDGDARLIGRHRVAARNDRLVWAATVSEGSEQRAAVLESRAPFEKVERVLQLDGPQAKMDIVEVAWAGDSIIHLIANASPNGANMSLHRWTGAQTELLRLDGLSFPSLLTDGGSAWFGDLVDDEYQLWRISPKEHRRVTTTAKPKFLTGTPFGLAWAEQHERTLSFHLAGVGPVGLEAPEIRAEILEAPALEPDAPNVATGANPSAPMPTIDGDLSVAIVTRIIRAHRKETEACYAAARKQNPELSGVLTIEFLINKIGDVDKIEIVGDAPDPELGMCVSRALAHWRFPESGDGKPVIVTYPFAFAMEQ